MVISEQMADVVLAAGIKVVEAEKILSFREKPLAEMRSEKAGAAGDQNPFHVADPSRSKWFTLLCPLNTVAMSNEIHRSKLRGV